MFSVCFIQQEMLMLLTSILSDHVIGPNGLLATKARILVTNGISFLHQFDKLAFVRRGVVLEFGSFEACMGNQRSELRKLMCVLLSLRMYPH